jgi:hypothetical protein
MDEIEPTQATGEATSPAGRPRFHSQREMLLYLFTRIRNTGRWWLLPLLGLAALLGVLLNVFAGHNVLPAIYSLIP